MTIRRAERQRTTFHTPRPTPRHRAEPSETEKQIAFLVAGMHALLLNQDPRPLKAEAHKLAEAFRTQRGAP